MSDLRNIGTIPRDSDKEILVKAGTYWNVEVVDIRWFDNDKPTRKGIRLNRKEAEQLLIILRRELE